MKSITILELRAIRDVLLSVVEGDMDVAYDAEEALEIVDALLESKDDNDWMEDNSETQLEN